MPARLRIGVNALYLIPGGVGGTEIYLRNLLAALARIDRRNQYFVFTNRETTDLCPNALNFDVVPGAVPARIRPLRLIWEQIMLPVEASRRGLDVMFSPGFTSPLLSTAAGVTVIHDLQHRKQPENFGAIERRAWDFSVWSSAKRSRRIITVSENSRRDILAAYQLNPKHVRVVHHGVESDFFALADNERYGHELLHQAGVPGDVKYLLAVSTVHPHKNWERLLEAYGHLIREGRREHLVICGLAGKASSEVAERLKDAQLAGRVHLLGWQPRAALLALYRFAQALVFPSTFEGFGMPVLEAMAAGIPVVCSDIPPLREFAAGAAHFFDPASSPALTDALREMFADTTLREQYIECGKARAAQFTWTRAAEQTLQVLLEAARR